MVKVGRERADLALQLKENEEEMQELIKKYKVGLNYSNGSSGYQSKVDRGYLLNIKIRLVKSSFFLNQASVAAGSTDQITIQDQAVTIQVLKHQLGSQHFLLVTNA